MMEKLLFFLSPLPARALTVRYAGDAMPCRLLVNRCGDAMQCQQWLLLLLLPLPTHRSKQNKKARKLTNGRAKAKVGAEGA